MKIALGINLQRGPFGGGNQFGRILSKFLEAQGERVVFNLKDKDIDLILLTETRGWLQTCAFDGREAIKYICQKPDTLLVMRVNECDERKGTKIQLLNKLIITNIQIADKIIFISKWLQNLFFAKTCHLVSQSTVIHNGANTEIFNPQGYQRWNHKEPLRIVTHHWGTHWHKGFDVYLYLDKILPNFKPRVTFTFIGNLPRKVKFKNTKVIPPQNGKQLASMLRQNHLYLAASQNEPAGMHHIEGALCGLPLLYRESGALPEYCQGYGLGFRGPHDLLEKIEKISGKYEYSANKMLQYNQTGGKMARSYYQLFLDLLKNKEEIIRQRKRNIPWYLWRNAILTKMCWLQEKTRAILNL